MHSSMWNLFGVLSQQEHRIGQLLVKPAIDTIGQTSLVGIVTKGIKMLMNLVSTVECLLKVAITDIAGYERLQLCNSI